MADNITGSGEKPENKPSGKPTGSPRTATRAVARPSGKRALTGEASSAAKKAPAKRDAKEVSSSRNPLTFLAEVWKEIRKVIWPTAKQMVIYTVIVVLFLAFMTALVAGVDFGAGWGVDQILLPKH